MTAENYRLRELDFLRGIAILLVLCWHTHFFPVISPIGWIGVDLFFVLSGFLVSGLLFREYLAFGNIQPGRFLIRRGFKIYPLYYLSYIIYLIQLVRHRPFEWIYFLGDMFFVQNYVLGWGYAMGASWSLAVEEHFYLVLVFVAWLLFNFKRKKQPCRKHPVNPAVVLYLVMALCLVCRIVVNLAFPNNITAHHTNTHLRMDSLLAGVLVSYWYHFKRDLLEKNMSAIKRATLPVCLLCLSFTPFIDYTNSFFVRTFGYCLLYTCFSTLLIVFLFTKDINARLNRLFSKMVVTMISKIGVHSYAIYIIHTAIIRRIWYTTSLNPYVGMFLFFAVSMLAGKLMSDYIERYFLRLRDKYYPKRSQ